MPLTFSGTLAQAFVCLSLSFPIWNVIIPDLTALQGSWAFCDIRAHECGMTLKSCKGTGGRTPKGKAVFARIWFPYCLRHSEGARGLRDDG